MINPAVIEQLQPYIVTAWHGHRNDQDIPKQVRDVWYWKFMPPRGTAQSNVDLAIINPEGEVVYCFDAFHRPFTRPPLSLAQYTTREVQRAEQLLQLDRLPPRTNPISLPGLDGQRGVRVFVTLKDDRMIAYQAPIVEVVPLSDSDWHVLDYPEQPRQVNAMDLHKWLSQVYPAGIMERTNQLTKKVYRIASTEGALSLLPAQNDGATRRAILSGTVVLTDEGKDHFSYQGRIRVVLTYPLDQPEPSSLKGVFEGIYPRRDRIHNRTRQLPLVAAFESLPAK